MKKESIIPLDTGVTRPPASYRKIFLPEEGRYCIVDPEGNRISDAFFTIEALTDHQGEIIGVVGMSGAVHDVLIPKREGSALQFQRSDMLQFQYFEKQGLKKDGAEMYFGRMGTIERMVIISHFGSRIWVSKEYLGIKRIGMICWGVDRDGREERIVFPEE